MAEGLGAGRTILVVDRDERARKLVDLHLSSAGYRVLAAADALAAVRLVLREPARARRPPARRRGRAARPLAAAA